MSIFSNYMNFMKFRKGLERPLALPAGKIFRRRTLWLLFFWTGGLCAGTSGNRTRPRRSRGAVQEKTECSLALPLALTMAAIVN